MDMKIKNDNIEKKLFQFSDNKGDAEKIPAPSVSFWKGAIKRLLRQKITMISVSVLVIIIICAILIPLGRYDLAFAQDLDKINLPPKMPFLENLGIMNGKRNGIDMYKDIKEYYFFGTDLLGRDIFMRLWLGIRTSLLLAFIVTMVELIVGFTVGAVSGYMGKTVDIVIQRIIEILVNIPMLIVVLLVSLALGQGFSTLTIALSLFSWIGFSRLVRSQILKYKELEFVLASKTLGASSVSILIKDMLPNILSIIVVALTLSFPTYILSEAFYTLLGVGLDPTKDLSLGQLIVDNVGKLGTYPSQLIIPTIFMGIISLAFNLFGNGLRDALDPKMKDR